MREAIINEGSRNGADLAYLQVASLNEKAVQLYSSLGFEKAYTYWYRVKSYSVIRSIDD